MELQRTNENKTSTGLQKILESEFSIAVLNNDFKKASDLLPKRIEQVFDQPKVNELTKALGSETVQLMIEFELINLAALMSVGGNLNNAQVPFIAEQLIGLYPNECIADFKLCFKRGAIGLYGDIQRLDGITIGGWMKAYLEEKYEVLESQLMKERDDLYKPIAPDKINNDGKPYDPDKHDQWLKKLSEAVKPVQKVPGMTDEEIRKLGNEKNKPRKPTITAGWAYYNVRGVQIYAESMEHAERLCELLLKNGDLEEID